VKTEKREKPWGVFPQSKTEKTRNIFKSTGRGGRFQKTGVLHLLNQRRFKNRENGGAANKLEKLQINGGKEIQKRKVVT